MNIEMVCLVIYKQKINFQLSYISSNYAENIIYIVIIYIVVCV